MPSSSGGPATLLQGLALLPFLSLPGTRSMSTLLHSSRPLLKHHPLPPRFEKNWNLKQEVPQYEFQVVAEPVPDLFNCTRSSARNFDLREKFHFHVEQLQRIVKRCKMSIRITNVANISSYEGSCNYPWHLHAFPSAEKYIKHNINKSKVDSQMR